MAHALGMKRMDLYLNFDKPLHESETANAATFVETTSQSRTHGMDLG